LPPRDPLPRLRLFRRFKICDRLNSSVCSVCSVSESTFWRSLPASLSDESWSSSWSSSSELDSDSELELELRLELDVRLAASAVAKCTPAERCRRNDDAKAGSR
jgi:hypothetical protein